MLTHEQRVQNSRKGGLARAAQFTTESQRAARAKVKPESLKKAGKLGYLACLEKFGKDFAEKRVADWRRKNPSSLVREVMDWLDQYGLSYETEALLGREYYADIYIATLNTVLEIDGKAWHSLDGFHGEGAQRVAADEAKTSALVALGYTVVRLSEDDIKSGVAAGILDGVMRGGK